MKCKFCEAQIEDGVLRCPECGANLVEETTKEEAPAKKISSGKLAVIYILVIVLLASLIAPVIVGMQNSSTTSSSTTNGTVPADGNKDDVTCQGSYTASEKTVKAKALKSKKQTVKQVTHGDGLIFRKIEGGALRAPCTVVNFDNPVKVALFNSHKGSHYFCSGSHGKPYKGILLKEYLTALGINKYGAFCG